MPELEPWRWVVVDPDTGIDLYTDGAKARDRAGDGVVAFPVYRSSSYGGNPAAVRAVIEAARAWSRACYQHETIKADRLTLNHAENDLLAALAALDARKEGTHG